MRITLSIAILTFGATAVQAQQTDILTILPNTRTEAGVFGQVSFDSNQESMNLAGVQYKKILNDKKGFRLIAGYSSYNGPEKAFSRGTAGDTAVDRFTETNINLGIVGAGIEMQRHFYKKVYLFAALELRGGYGTGSHDTLVRKTSSSGMPYAFGTKEGRTDATMVYVGLMPSIGAKLQFKKLTVGTELSGIESSFKQQRIENRSSYGVMDVIAGQFSQRIFVNYRF